MTEDSKDYKVVFAPGCFDEFAGTQEELNELVSEITNLVTSGKFFEESEHLDLDVEELPENLQQLISDMDKVENKRNKRLN